MKIVKKIGKMYIERNELLDITVVDKEKAFTFTLYNRDAVELYEILKEHITELVKRKSCAVCKNYDETYCQCDNREKFESMFEVLL